MASALLSAKQLYRSQTRQTGANMAVLNDYDDLANYTDKAVIQSQNVSDIFPGCNTYSGLYVLKITNPENGATIWRQMSTYGVTGVTKGDVALPYSAMWDLGIIRDADCHDVLVEDGSQWMFYWHHPIHATRISFRMAIYTCVISALISVILSFV